MASYQLISPSRLHFGLLSFNNPQVPQFGGLGMMVDAPNLLLSARHSSTFEATGRHADRVVEFAMTWTRFYRRPTPPPVAIEVLSAPPQHVGLGLGTQLGMSVGQLLNKLLLDRPISIAELAKSVSRGKRSSVGTLGFMSGGMIFERGKAQRNTISADHTRVAVPENWKIVLVTRRRNPGLSGKSEQSAFDKLPPVPEKTTERLTRLASETILPCAIESRFFEFSEALYAYGELAGRCFSSLQGGAFADKDLELKIDALRKDGVLGVGQSSWGPTIFSFHEGEDAADDFIQSTIKNNALFDECDIIVASANNTGHSLS